MRTLDDVSIKIPFIENNPLKFYYQGTLIPHTSSTEEKTIPLSSADGMATFK
ncbi:MAG: hypothetical protein IJ193_07230 [Bacilli bacterium]|nr:hypothetical protein [Bacilli bacterium]